MTSIFPKILELVRFIVIGLLNTIIDFFILNLLIYSIEPQSSIAFFTISLFSVLVAATNGFIMHKYWSFRRKESYSPIMTQAWFFALITLATMFINSSIFLFIKNHLETRVDLSPFLIINLSKCAGVLVAMIFSLFGYRFVVFYPKHVKEFREQEPFKEASRPLPINFILSCFCISLCFRLCFLLITTAIQGDAVNYFWVAKYLWIPENTDLIDPFWSNGFTFWETFLFSLPIPEQKIPIIATLIPGTYLVIPLARIANILFNRNTAITVALLSASHPRLIEYSCNGYIDIFSLLFIILMVEQMTKLIYHWVNFTNFKWTESILLGVYSAIAMTTRNELVVFYLFMIGSFAILIVKLCRTKLLDHFQMASISFLSFSSVLLFYVTLSLLSVNSLGLFQKQTNIYKPVSEQVDMEEASKWTYQNKNQPHVFDLDSFIKRTRALIILTIQILPGVIATPAILFGFFYFGIYPRKIFEPTYLPLFCIGIIPFCIYPFINVEPRYLFPLLVPTLLFSSAGIISFVEYIKNHIYPHKSLALILTCLCSIHTVVFAYKASDIKEKYMIHNQLKDWISYHIPKNAVIYGCGYGYITTTGFLTGHRTYPRHWTESIHELVINLRANRVEWVVMYEEYLEKANPSLLTSFRGFMPYLKQEYIAKDSRGYYAKVYSVPKTEF